MDDLSLVAIRPERLLFRVEEAAEATGVSRAQAYKFVSNGEWPIVRVGRAIRVPTEGLRDWVRDRTELVGRS
jgi:excisionase family DNA binding protein